MIHLEVHTKSNRKEIIHPDIECISFVYYEDKRKLGIYGEFDNIPSYWIEDVTKIVCLGG